MAFPTVEAVNGGYDDTAGTSHTVNLPSGIESGDLLLVFFGSDGNPTITFPEGWTELFNNAYDSDVRFGCWYRVADGTEGSSITVTTSDSEITAHTSYRITGYSDTPEAGTAATGWGSSPDSPSLSPSWGAEDTLWFACCGVDGSVTITQYPTNYTNGRQDMSGLGPGCNVNTARRELNAASENPGAFTLSVAQQWVANTVAVRPTAVTYVELTGVANGVASVSGQTAITRGLAGLASGVCSVSALAVVTYALAGISAGIAAVSGTISRITQLAGVSAGAASVSGTLSRLKLIAGVAAGACITAGSIAITRALAGVSAGVASVSGSLARLKLLAGVSAGVATVTGKLFFVRTAIRVLAAVRNLVAVRNIPPVR